MSHFGNLDGTVAVVERAMARIVLMIAFKMSSQAEINS
jgi:hypothetical protein